MSSIDVTIDNDDGFDEAGTSYESMVITTDSLEELSQEMSTELAKLSVVVNNESAEKEDDDGSVVDEQQIQSNSNGVEIGESSKSITEIQDECTASDDEKLTKINSSSNSSNKLLENEESSEKVIDYLHDPEWLNKMEHVFILSTAGKPIYSLHGTEDKLATLFGVMQALVSVFQSNQDTIMSIHSIGIQFVFLVRSPLILVAASRKQLSVQQIQLQLTDVYNQILSTLTLSHMTKIFEKRKNFDLRRLLAGSERLIDHLLIKDNLRKNDTNTNTNRFSNKPFIFMTHSVRILQLTSTIRDNITSAIQSNCSKIKNLVFAVLIANNKLIALVRMKKYFIHPADLRLIFNLVECSESFKAAESWTPICLPKFDPNGFLHAHVSYLADDCQACLMLLSVERDVFFTLSDAKKKITDKLRRSQCLKAINDSMEKSISLKIVGIPEIRHFLYKSKSNAQLLCSEIDAPYNTQIGYERLQNLYYDVHHRIHNINRPLKLIYEMKENEIVLAWITTGYELYAIFEPLVEKNSVIALVNTLLDWIKREEDSLFILNAPTF